ncbi:hypothetical protein QR680_009878 [Steinernema hermaphroditum]|uniref:MHD domain-containing protein n=1 Tax=Steinernema hermaphroditum TaxID=289476 RepID=A0AA39INV8_9BILA|nr:hypothetical protein QR680_009878 [Steinernema hermaphroditum]
MSSSAIFILDLKGKVIIARNYRGDVDMSVIEKFIPVLMEMEEEGQQSPIITVPEATFVYIKCNNVYLVSTSTKNVNVAVVLAFLYKCVQVFTEYFKDVEEESIRDNFVIIYELLDEMMDFGYPQTTDGKILQEYITQEGHKLEAAPRPPMAVTNAVSWRSEGIKYRKNEVFLDVIESVNLLANANGTVLQSEIVGSVKMRVYLTGMPELRLGLNDKVLFESNGRGGKGKSVELEDVKFHQCVRLSRFENDRTISFIPPDGEFELMNYRLMTVVKPLIWIEAVVERYSHSRVEYMIKAKSQFKRRSTANNVEVIIPVPSDADSPKFKTSIGTVKYAPELSSFVWTIKSFPGGKEFLMRAHFNLPSVTSEEKEGRPPIKVKFEIPYFTTSGIQVRYLKIIEKSGYQALPWILMASVLGRRLFGQFLYQRTSRLLCIVAEQESYSGYSSAELKVGADMLKRVTHELRREGKTFILPLGDEDALQRMLKPLHTLVDAGVKPEFLLDAFVKRSELFKALVVQGEKSMKVLDALVETCGMTFEDAMRMLASYPEELLAVSAESIFDRLSVFFNSGILAGKEMGRIVRTCPAILFTSDGKQMATLVEGLTNFFARGEIRAMLEKTPHIVITNLEELEQKYEYIYFMMRIEGDEFKMCTRWVDMSLDEIIMRHDFLQKTGKYTTPDPKKPQFKMENPTLSKILDLPDVQFATEIAGVTMEEWTVYRAFMEKQREMANKERPFERIKPSVRKAFERRRKEAKKKEDHVIQ